jgi:hypothetical protein
MKKPLMRLMVMAIALATTSAIGWAAVCFREIVTESDVVRQPEDSFPTRNWVLYFRSPLTGTGALWSGPRTRPPASAVLKWRRRRMPTR